jgi:hypothetical protein
MTRIVRFLAVTGSAGVIALVLSLTSAGPAVAQTFKPVMSFIINDASNPVPVVDVGAVVPASEEPFQHDVSSFVQASLSLQVPEDKRAVLEFYSGTAATAVPCAVAAIAITTNLGDGALQHRVAATPVVQGQASEFNQYVISQQVRLYAAPGTSIQFSPSTIPGCPTSFLGVVSGYFIDVP